jgi:hypothetical protein
MTASTLLRARKPRAGERRSRRFVASSTVAVALTLAFSTAAATTGVAPAHALTNAYTCTLAPNSWCASSERHSYITVITGQNNWFNNDIGQGSQTSKGWWCSKLVNQDNGAEYGRVCDFAVTTWAQIGSAPSDHMLPYFANGNNAGTQTIRGCAKTSNSQFCSANG